MKRLVIFSVLLICSLVLTTCNKDDDKTFNVLKITSGEFNGHTHSYSPNTGFWSPVNETVHQVHLVLGGTENIVTDYENKMSIMLYYSGQQTIDFPTPEGQWVIFGLWIEGTLYYFHAEDAALTIDRLDNTIFEGKLSGDFGDSYDDSRITTVAMDIMVNLQEL